MPVLPLTTAVQVVSGLAIPQPVELERSLSPSRSQHLRGVHSTYTLHAARAGLDPGLALQVDPTLTRADRLVGQVLGEVGQLPDVYTELEINFFLLRRLLGVRTSVRP